MKLTNWTAKRAGGRITVYGTNHATGRAAKIVGVDHIQPKGRFFPRLSAVDAKGAEHILAV